jgi:hypothetical protein
MGLDERFVLRKHLLWSVERMRTLSAPELRRQTDKTLSPVIVGNLDLIERKEGHDTSNRIGLARWTRKVDMI